MINIIGTCWAFGHAIQLLWIICIYLLLVCAIVSIFESFFFFRWMWTLSEQVIYEQVSLKYNAFFLSHRHFLYYLISWPFISNESMSLRLFCESLWKIKSKYRNIHKILKKKNGYNNNNQVRPIRMFIVYCVYDYLSIGVYMLFFFPRRTQMYIDFAVAYLLRLIVLNLAHKNSNVFAHREGLTGNLSPIHNIYIRYMYVYIYA